MAYSIVGSTTVTFQARPQAQLSSPLLNKSLGSKPSVSFRRTTSPRMPALRIVCAAKDETVEKVCDVVKEKLSLEKDHAISGDTKFVDLGADSLDTVEIVMRLEEVFDVHIEEDSSQGIATIGDAAQLIEEIKNKK